jgi:NAD(P)-dependent dehydrogenase (short-subunit alcohol dehydrogenase family)
MKKALITGGQGDIAIAMADKIKNNYIVFRPNKEELNVTDLRSVNDYIESNGPFDLIINNAGSIHPMSLLDSNEEKWVNDIMVNLVGTYYVSKKGLEHNRLAIIINIASTAAYAAYKDWGSYCASKAALITFTKSMANDDFSAFAIAPGAVLTKFRDNFNLPNDNAQDTNAISSIVIEILEGLYKPGDVIFSRKGEKKIL